MIDKKINDSIDLLIKKLKEKDLVSIKITNKTNSIEVTNNLIYENSNQRQVKANLTMNSEAPAKENSSNMITIDSPMVGIIYITPKPSSPPFVKKGQKVKKGDTICLIEAMKTFNEIKSDKDGLIKGILVKNGEAVEFGQPLFEIS
jgi:acetyl-CoA carboxylase biotin carboxyl carrier protein